MKKHLLLFTILSLFVFTQMGWASITSNGTGGGNWSVGATWNGGSAPGPTDDVVIADNDIVTIDTSPISVVSITVGSGTGGTLLFDRTTGRALTVTGNITVNAGGSFLSTDFNALTPTGDLTLLSQTITNVSSTAGIVVGMNIGANNFQIPSATTVTAFTANTITISAAPTIAGTTVPLTIQLPAITQTLTIGGNIINNGTFDMSKAVSTVNSSTTFCNVVFNNTGGDQTISGTTPALTRFQGITLSKSSITNKVVSTIDTYIGGSNLFVLTAGTWNQHARNLINGAGNKTLGVAAGKLLIDGSGGYINYVGPNYQIPRYTSASLAVTAGVFEVNTSGLVQIGIGNNSITSGGTINLLGGNIYIYGRLTITNGVNTINGANIYIDPNPDPLSGTQSSSSLLTNAAALGITSSTFEVSAVYTSPTTSFTFSSGSVTLVNPISAATTGRDFKVTASGTGVSITGGTIYIGDGSSTQISTGTVPGFLNGSSSTLIGNNIVVQTGNIPGRNFVLNSTELPIAGTLTIAANGVLDCSAKLVKGTGAFTLSSGATIKAQKVGGINGVITSTGTITLSPGANYEFDGAVASAVTGTLMPTTVNDLIMNNSSGIALSQATLVNGTLTLTSGKTTLGANNLTVSSISGGSATSYIVTDGAGTLIRNVGSSVTYPVGLATDYTPITFSTTSSARNYGVKVVTITPSGSAHGLARQWVVNELTHPSNTVFGSMTLSWNATAQGTLTDPTCDVVANTTGNVNSYDLLGTGLTISSRSVTFTPAPQGPILDITGGLYITAVQPNSALPVELSSFTSNVNGRNISLNWETKTEKNSNKFEIQRCSVDNSNWTIVGNVKAAVLSNSPKEYSYSDTKLQSGKYQYRLKMIDNDGSFSFSTVQTAEVAIPKDFALSQNYPNPFNPSTKIDYQVPVDAKVIMEIYNVAGQKVSELVNQDQSAGYYTVDFGASKLSSGVYIYRLAAINKATGNNFSSIKKMMFLK